MGGSDIILGTEAAGDPKKLVYVCRSSACETRHILFEKLPARCLIAGFSNNPDRRKCITRHPKPFIGDKMSEGKKERIVRVS